MPAGLTEADNKGSVWVDADANGNANVGVKDWSHSVRSQAVSADGNVSSPGMAGRALSYDDNGNLTQAIVTVNGVNVAVNYTWDEANQLVGYAVAGGKSSEFTYDGLGRRVRIVDKDESGAVIADRYFVWDGMRIAEERATPDGVPVKIFCAQGEVRTGGVKFYYTRDHLGSVREVVDVNSKFWGHSPLRLFLLRFPTDGLVCCHGSSSKSTSKRNPRERRFDRGFTCMNANHQKIMGGQR